MVVLRTVARCGGEGRHGDSGGGVCGVQYSAVRGVGLIPGWEDLKVQGDYSKGMRFRTCKLLYLVQYCTVPRCV